MTARFGKSKEERESDYKKPRWKLTSWTVFSFKTFWTLARIVVYFICALATVFARWDATFINIWREKRKAFTHNVSQWNSNFSYHSTPVDHASILVERYLRSTGMCVLLQANVSLLTLLDCFYSLGKSSIKHLFIHYLTAEQPFKKRIICGYLF